jgi:hypothetical protein
MFSGATGREFESLRAHQIPSFLLNHSTPRDLGGIFGISALCPELCPAEVGHGGKNRALRGVDVATGNCDWRVTCDPRQCSGVAARLS